MRKRRVRTNAQKDRRMPNRAGIGRIMSRISVKMLSAPRMMSCPRASEHVPGSGTTCQYRCSGRQSVNVTTWITTYVAANIPQYIFITTSVHGSPNKMRLYKTMTTYFCSQILSCPIAQRSSNIQNRYETLTSYYRMSDLQLSTYFQPLSHKFLALQTHGAREMPG
jgi:hypothetical protein